MIEIKDLSLTFKNADEDHEALKAVTLDIPRGLHIRLCRLERSRQIHPAACYKRDIPPRQRQRHH